MIKKIKLKREHKKWLTKRRQLEDRLVNCESKKEREIIKMKMLLLDSLYVKDYEMYVER